MKEALQDRVAATIRDYCAVPPLAREAMAVLGRPGYALHPEASCRSGLFTLHVFASICGPPSAAAFALAAAVELQMEAAFLFDSVADEDAAIDRQSRAKELALAIALLQCGNGAACEALRASGHAIDAIVQSQRAYVTACGGQLLDALLETSEGVSSDQALQMTCLKSGSLGRFAAGLGARAATRDSDLIALCETLGANAFTFAQLVDDLRDACSPDGSSDDLARHKKTVPLVFFLSQGRAAPIAPPACRMVSTRQVVWQAYVQSGARLYGAIMAEAFLNRTKGNLASLRDRRCAVEELEGFVASLDGDFRAAITFR